MSLKDSRQVEVFAPRLTASGGIAAHSSQGVDRWIASPLGFCTLMITPGANDQDAAGAKPIVRAQKRIPLDIAGCGFISRGA
jgi:hypothetical protein